MKRNIVLMVWMFGSLFSTSAQNTFNVANRVVFENKSGNLNRITAILPVPQSNNYQTVSGLQVSEGDILPVPNSGNLYLRNIKTFDLPAAGNSACTTETFEVSLYPMHIDFSQFKKMYPYDTLSEIYRRYTSDKGGYIDTNHPVIQTVSDSLWEQSGQHIIGYARLCYEYVGANYKYLNPNTGIHPIADILTAGGGDCGNLSSLFVTLLRAKRIPARHIVTVRPDNSYHVWSDFYLEKYGWIPVDVTMKLDFPNGDFFGYCRGDGIVMSDDICFDIEPLPNENYPAVLLQNYYYWYYGECRLNTAHEVKGEIIRKTNAPVVSGVKNKRATLMWQPATGATGYRITLYDSKNGNKKMKTYQVSSSQTSFELKGLKPATPYEIEFIPCRKIGNIETTMDSYKTSFHTL